MRIRKLEYEYLCNRYENLKTIWHNKIKYLRNYEQAPYTSFIQRAWIRLYILQIKREMEEILFKIGKLHKYVPCDWCASKLDKEI